MSNKNSDYYFLKGGGEMGELIRAKDWSKTSLGEPASWPQSLRTMVAVMLDNPFGMYIAWGNDYIQLYNDGYRPILGATKHPQALGISTRETFSEIWDDIIGSMFDEVMEGKAVGYPDFMLPLNRNGFVEQCYFDFAYSPIRKDNGEVGGVLVTVIETTDKKKVQTELLESTDQLKFAIDAAELGTWDYNPATNKFTANNRLKKWFGLSASEQIELHHATDVIAEKDRERILMAITETLDYASGGNYEEEYSIINPVTKKEIIVHGKGKAWFNEDRTAYRFTGVLQEVTDKVVSRKSIEESEARFRAIADDAPVFIFLAGDNAEVEYFNKTWCDYTGISINDYKGKAWVAITHIEDVEPATAIYMDGFNKQKSCSFENRQKGMDGIYRTILWKATPRFTPDGQFIGMMGVGLDIHERKISENSLLKSEEKYRTLFNSIDQGFLLGEVLRNSDGKGIDYYVHEVNSTYEKQTGISIEMVLGKTVLQAFPTIDRWWIETYASVVDSQSPVKFEKFFEYTNRWFEIKASPAGKEMFTILFTDITETRLAVEKIKESEEQFSTLADNMENHAWLADGEGLVYWYNKRWLEYTGLSLEEVKGWGWQKVHHPDHVERLVELYKKLWHTNETFELTYPLRRQDGVYRWFLTRGYPVTDEGGKILRWIGTSTDIHEQKKAEEHFRQMAERMPQKIFTADAVGNRDYFNKVMLDYTGLPFEELKDWGWKKIIHPKDWPKVKPKWLHSINTGEDFENEVRLLRKDGKYLWHLVRATAIKDKKGKPKMWFGSKTDIQEQKTFTQELEEKVNERTAQLIKNNMELENRTIQLEEAQQLAHIGSWEWDVVKNKIEWSDELYRIFGLTPQEFIADYDNYLKYIHDDDREYVNAIVQKAFKDHESYKFFHKTASADGNVRILSATGKVITDADGNIIRMSGTAQDVTEQKKYEEELKISEERFFRIFDSNPIPMSLTEIKTNKIKYANNLFYQLFGYNKQEIIGRTSEELNLLDPEEYKRVIDLIFGFLHENRTLAEVQALSKEETEALLLKLNESEKMKDFEILYTRKNGEKFPVIVSYEVISIGTESYTVTSYQDITLRKKAEAELRKQNDQLEKMNKELQSFTYISSHDLQEPLRKIQTFVSRILEKEENNLSENGKYMFKRMQYSAKRMQMLIQDLLAYSRITTVKSNFVTTDLAKIITEIKEDLKEELNEKKAKIVATQLCHANIIPFQFTQMMLNLISNALKFSHPNHPPIIQIKSELRKSITFDNEKLLAQNDYCHITVSDNGIGFEQQYSEKIFEVFQRLHDKDVYEGTGIGLSIVKKIVDNHNGMITAHSEPNNGATFEIYIPVL